MLFWCKKIEKSRFIGLSINEIPFCCCYCVVFVDNGFFLHVFFSFSFKSTTRNENSWKIIDGNFNSQRLNITMTVFFHSIVDAIAGGVGGFFLLSGCLGADGLLDVK